MTENRAVMAALTIGKIALQTSPDLPKGVISPSLPKGEEGYRTERRMGRLKGWLMDLIFVTCLLMF